MGKTVFIKLKPKEGPVLFNISVNDLDKGICYGLAVAGNKSAMRPPFPPPGCSGEWKETDRNWRVGIKAV